MTVDDHFMAIQGYIWLALHALHQFFHFPLRVQLGLEVAQGKLVRLTSRLPCFSVYVNLPAAILRFQCLSQSADSGNPHSPGQDGRVAVAGTALGDEP